MQLKNQDSQCQHSWKKPRKTLCFVFSFALVFFRNLGWIQTSPSVAAAAIPGAKVSLGCSQRQNSTESAGDWIKSCKDVQHCTSNIIQNGTRMIRWYSFFTCSCSSLTMPNQCFRLTPEIWGGTTTSCSATKAAAEGSSWWGQASKAMVLKDPQKNNNHQKARGNGNPCGNPCVFLCVLQMPVCFLAPGSGPSCGQKRPVCILCILM